MTQSIKSEKINKASAELIMYSIDLWKWGEYNFRDISFLFNKYNLDYQYDEVENIVRKIINNMHNKRLGKEEFIEEIKKKGVWEVVVSFAEKYQKILKCIGQNLAQEYLVDGIPDALFNEKLYSRNLDDKKPLFQFNREDFEYENFESLQESFEKMVDLLKVKYELYVDGKILLNVLYEAIVDVTQLNNQKEYKKFKNILTSEKPKNKEDFINAFLKHFGEDYANKILYLTEILNEMGYQSEISEVTSLVDKGKKKLELERFEQSLRGGEPAKKINLDLLDGYEFESFLGDLFKKMGYKVISTKLSGDQGADLIVERFGERIAVQAKCYSGSVGNKAIQEVVASKNHYKCDKTMVITTSYFTRQALNLAKSNDVELWNRNKLEEMIKRCSTFENDQDEDYTDEKSEDEELPICKICDVNTTSNPDEICDDCKFSMISNDDIPPSF